MFGGNNQNPRRPIGVAVTGTGVVLAQASRPGTDASAGYTLAAQASAPLDASIKPGDAGYDAALADAITAALKQDRFVGKQCVSAMPAESLRYKNVRLPKMPEHELPQAVAWEAKERAAHAGPSATQYYFAGEVRQGHDIRCEVVLLTAPQPAVDAHVRGLTMAGLKPEAIEANAAALARAATPCGQTNFILQVGEHALEAVIAQGERVLLNKLLPASDGIAQADHAELAREIGLCLRYHSVTFRGEKPGRLFLAGQAAPETLVQAVRDALAIDVLPLGDAMPGTLGPEPRRIDTCSAVAAGLSLRTPSAQTQRGAA